LKIIKHNSKTQCFCIPTRNNAISFFYLSTNTTLTMDQLPETTILDLPILVLMTVVSYLSGRDLFKLAQTCRDWQSIIDDNKRGILRSKANLNSPEIREFIMENFPVNTITDFWITLRLLEFQPSICNKNIILNFGPTKIQVCRLISEFDLLDYMFIELSPESGNHVHELLNRELYVKYRYMVDNGAAVPYDDNGRSYSYAIIRWVKTYNMIYVDAICNLLRCGIPPESFSRSLYYLYNNRESGVPRARINMFRNGERLTHVIRDLDEIGFDIDRLCELD